VAGTKRHDYRHVSPFMWGDRNFIKLSHAEPNAQTLWVYLLTGPHTTALPGLSVAGPRQLAEALGWPYEQFAPCLEEITSKDMAWVDRTARVIAVANAPRYDPPASPNVVKYWRKLYEEVPDCEVKTRYRLRLQAFLRGFGRSFAEAFSRRVIVTQRDPSPNPVPDPVPDPIPRPEDQNHRAQKPRAEAEPPGFADFWQAYPRKVGKGAALKAYRKAAAECEAIKRALEWQADSADHLKRETKFIPYPATWLSQRRWEDPVPAGNGLDHDPGDY
jgi:hypothetical protein